jgi:hypothetical protein
MNKELITIIDDNNVMYVGEHHYSNDWVSATAKHYTLKNLVTVGYTKTEDGKISVSLSPVGIPEILSKESSNIMFFASSKIKIVNHSEFTPEFLEKYNSSFASNVQ